jgi:hypothetical protein
MKHDTEIMDKLYLELSHFTEAETAKELDAKIRLSSSKKRMNAWKRF